MCEKERETESRGEWQCVRGYERAHYQSCCIDKSIMNSVINHQIRIAVRSPSECLSSGLTYSHGVWLMLWMPSLAHAAALLSEAASEAVDFIVSYRSIVGWTWHTQDSRIQIHDTVNVRASSSTWASEACCYWWQLRICLIFQWVMVYPSSPHCIFPAMVLSPALHFDHLPLFTLLLFISSISLMYDEAIPSILSWCVKYYPFSTLISSTYHYQYWSTIYHLLPTFAFCNNSCVFVW